MRWLTIPTLLVIACSPKPQSIPPPTHHTHKPQLNQFLAVDDDSSLAYDPSPISSVGMLLLGDDLASADEQCTVTLVGCDAALTARHCIHYNDTGPLIPHTRLFVFLPHVGSFDVDRYAEGDANDPNADIAMLYLHGRAVLPVVPTIHGHGSYGAGRITGFGNATSNRQAGLRRSAKISFSACGTNQLCWYYQPNHGQATTCAGDSGGPLFDSAGRIAGVHSSGSSYVCGGNDHAIDIDLSAYSSVIDGWLQGHPACSQGDVSTWAEAGNDGDSWSLPLDHPAQALRVAADGEFIDEDDLHLVIQAPDQRVVCNAHPAHAWAYCEVPNASAGEYVISPQRPDSTEVYQLSFTLR